METIPYAVSLTMATALNLSTAYLVVTTLAYGVIVCGLMRFLFFYRRDAIALRTWAQSYALLMALAQVLGFSQCYDWN